MVLSEFNLQGKVAIVTGAGRGLGQAIALTFAEAGASIAAAARTIEQLEQTAEEVRKHGGVFLAIPTDVTNHEQVDEMVVKSLSRFGKIDILVNNAGIMLEKPLVVLPRSQSEGEQTQEAPKTPLSEEEWHRVIDTNLTSIFLCCRAVGPHMIERRSGKIINMSSMVAAKGSANLSAYSASKAAVSNFTRSLALEWARFNINVNAIAPGSFLTAITAPIYQDPKRSERRLRTIPLGRAGQPREVGLLAVYLASDASNYLTGQTIYLDGGILA